MYLYQSVHHCSNEKKTSREMYHGDDGVYVGGSKCRWASASNSLSTGQHSMSCAIQRSQSRRLEFLLSRLSGLNERRPQHIELWHRLRQCHCRDLTRTLTSPNIICTNNLEVAYHATNQCAQAYGTLRDAAGHVTSSIHYRC